MARGWAENHPLTATIISVLMLPLYFLVGMLAALPETWGEWKSEQRELRHLRTRAALRDEEAK